MGMEKGRMLPFQVAPDHDMTKALSKISFVGSKTEEQLVSC